MITNFHAFNNSGGFLCVLKPAPLLGTNTAFVFPTLLSHRQRLNWIIWLSLLHTYEASQNNVYHAWFTIFMTFSWQWWGCAPKRTYHIRQEAWFKLKVSCKKLWSFVLYWTWVLLVSILHAHAYAKSYNHQCIVNIICINVNKLSRCTWTNDGNFFSLWCPKTRGWWMSVSPYHNSGLWAILLCAIPHWTILPWKGSVHDTVASQWNTLVIVWFHLSSIYTYINMYI